MFKESEINKDDMRNMVITKSMMRKSEVKPVSHNPSDFRTESDYDLLQRLLADPIFKIPEHLPQKIMNEISIVMDDPNIEHTTKISAINTIIKLQKLNLDAVKMVMPHRTETVVDVRKLTDEELMEQLSKVHDRIYRQ